ncbi:peptidoglycan/xylan/chitin deacetylase (PgdA/CDA1 family) [Pseudoclavibacter sp. JAI123]|uniref:polysaccharide deacetylase family protein n=1 Tax=Pseudoclavibacter sp. JAI123 TaxID=2723065 RepID=UPI0015CC8945|nr:polysaccharide deacetylase family protein [Pseudoclavibacter sp. JAI123]NYF12065.1 peptidoglycan/xylan/chitin deacetylase (PgdA/CDA1 family) [Pseudoclavibacter sp. JAI123]
MTAVGRAVRAGLFISIAALLAMAIAPGAAAEPVAPDEPVESAGQTVVSLTFDDGNANQMLAAPILAEHAMEATFFIPSGFVDTNAYVSRADLEALSAAGHEIGGHTVNHFDLAFVPLDEAKRQICTDRATLLSWGYEVRNFAYPHGSSLPGVEQTVQECGYNSARELGDLRTRFGCDECESAEALPPANPYSTDAPQQVESEWTLDDLKAVVLDAERTGGWTQLTFHDVCVERCSDIRVTPTMLADFLAWLEPRASTHDTVVRTVGDVIGGPLAPAVEVPPPPAVEPGVNGIVNPGMEELNEEDRARCWTRTGWGESRVHASTVGEAHTGAWASRMTLVDHESGETKLMPRFDLGWCSPGVTAGTSYSLRTWYTSSTPTQFVVFLRAPSGAWTYWSSSPWFEASTTYAHAVWEPPPIPGGYTGISFGLSLFSNGTLTVDDAALYEADGAPPAQLPPVTPPQGRPEGPHVLAPGPDRISAPQNPDRGAPA